MIETTGDFWAYKADWKLIPTNGIVKKNGDAVMGAGLARDARDRFPGMAAELGERLQKKGNVPFLLLSGGDDPKIFSFPTKEHFSRASTMPLIQQSAEEFRLIYDRWIDGNPTLNPPIVLFPHLGCGFGGLRWDNVRPLLQKIFPEDNFIAIGFDRGGAK